MSRQGDRSRSLDCGGRMAVGSVDRDPQPPAARGSIAGRAAGGHAEDSQIVDEVSSGWTAGDQRVPRERAGFDPSPQVLGGSPPTSGDHGKEPPSASGLILSNASLG